MRADVIAALERAVRYGAYSYAAVERILAVQARPKSVLDTLAEEELPPLPASADDLPVFPRPSAAYQQLLDEEPDNDDEDSDPPAAVADDGPA